MTTNALAMPIAQEDRDRGWLWSRRWDLTYLIGSAVLAPLPLVLYHGLGVSTTLINLLVGLLVGGPHMYSTFTTTYMERRFLRRYPLYAALGLVIPLIVIYLGVVNLTLLITLFLFWASVHALHQVSYLSDCYRARAGHERTLWPRLVDYVVILTSLYPIAFYKMTRNQFVFEGRLIAVPPFMRADWVWMAAALVFGTALVLFITKSVAEYRTGVLSAPKTLLIAVTVALAFSVPAVHEVDIALQGFNTWHSFQYLALMWYMTRLRQQRGQISSPVIQKLASSERSTNFYLFNLAITIAGGLLMQLVFRLSGLSFDQSYYIVVLSALLVHYYLDHFLFTRIEAVVPRG